MINRCGFCSASHSRLSLRESSVSLVELGDYPALVSGFIASRRFVALSIRIEFQGHGPPELESFRGIRIQ